jgi:hypothetical protein
MMMRSSVFFDELRREYVTPWSQYVAEAVPAMQALKDSRRIRAWGIRRDEGPAMPRDIIGKQQRGTLA